MSSAEELRAAAKALEPALREAVEPGERDRGLSAGLVDALWEAGLLSMAAPRDRGGAALDPLARIRLIESIAATNASAAWVLMICNAYAYWAGALLAPDVLDSFWQGGTRMIIAGTTDPVGRAERVAGGHRLSGRWRFGSGSLHATHFASGALVFDEGKLVRREDGSPLFRVFVTPASAVSIDTASWDALGLRGTSSHDYAIDDAFVPEGRHFQPAFDTSWRTEAQYRYLAIEQGNMVAVSLGIARAALDELTAIVERKRDRMTRSAIADLPAHQELVGRTEAGFAAARAFFFEQLESLWSSLSAGDAPTLRQRALWRTATVQAVTSLRDVVARVHAAAGSDAVFRKSPIERCFRDIHTAATHVAMRESAFVEAGALLLGRPPPFTGF